MESLSEHTVVLVAIIAVLFSGVMSLVVYVFHSTITGLKEELKMDRDQREKTAEEFKAKVDKGSLMPSAASRCSAVSGRCN